MSARRFGIGPGIAIALASALALAACPARSGHPYPQPRPEAPLQWQSADGSTTHVLTREGRFPAVDPFGEPPGSNFLRTVHSNVYDGRGEEMPNTLPSTPDVPFNLHGGPVRTSAIAPASPTTDLVDLFRRIRRRARDEGVVDLAAVERAIDVLEGNPLPGRAYSGLPLLHYKGPEKVKRVRPIFDPETGRKVGGHVAVHQVWFDNHIESDTAFLDPSEVLDLPWTITYTVDCLDRCQDDFAPFVMYTDDPSLAEDGMPPSPHVGMDQTFFPMKEGTRNVFEIKMSRGRYYGLTYTWGWRWHPPRVQVIENARKVIGGKALPDWEIDVFGRAPSASRPAKRAAIARIGDLSPAKRMWMALESARAAGPDDVPGLLDEAEAAFEDWRDRTELPRGVRHLADPGADMTLFYVNNTIYGRVRGGGLDDWEAWRKRPATFRATLLNGDYFEHGYMNVDFGGARGWENQFQSTAGRGGIGCKFTMGRVHWWVNAGPPWGDILVPPADPRRPGSVGRHEVEITFNFEPSRRLRIYQFDPLHHDVAVYSLH
jgi:hypothetical protein